MTAIKNKGRNPLVVHTKTGSKTVLPGASIDAEFDDNEIKSMRGHPDIDFGAKKSKDDDGDKTPPAPPGLPPVGDK